MTSRNRRTRRWCRRTRLTRVGVQLSALIDPVIDQVDAFGFNAVAVYERFRAWSDTSFTLDKRFNTTTLSATTFDAVIDPKTVVVPSLSTFAAGTVRWMSSSDRLALTATTLVSTDVCSRTQVALLGPATGHAPHATRMKPILLGLGF